LPDTRILLPGSHELGTRKSVCPIAELKMPPIVPLVSVDESLGQADGRFRCTECSHTLSTKRGIELHLRKIHGVQRTSKKHAFRKFSEGCIRCLVCTNECSTYKQALTHERREHPDVTMTENVTVAAQQAGEKRRRRQAHVSSGAALREELSTLAQTVFNPAFMLAANRGVTASYGDSAVGTCDGLLCGMKLSGLWALGCGKHIYCANCALALDGWPPKGKVFTALSETAWTLILSGETTSRAKRRRAFVQQGPAVKPLKWVHSKNTVVASGGLGRRTTEQPAATLDTETRVPGEAFDEVKRTVVGPVMRAAERFYNPSGSQFASPTAEGSCGLVLFTHGDAGVTHMHADRGGAVNLMLYGGVAFWLCVDCKHLSAGEVVGVVAWEHAQARVTSAEEAAKRVVETQRLVSKPGAVYMVEQRPGQLITVAAGVLHAVYTLSSGAGACKFAFDFPPTGDLVGYFLDRALLVKASRMLAAQDLNLAGWGKATGDCVDADGWVMACIAALPPQDGL
jgi:ferredoxin